MHYKRVSAAAAAAALLAALTLAAAGSPEPSAAQQAPQTFELTCVDIRQAAMEAGGTSPFEFECVTSRGSFEVHIGSEEARQGKYSPNHISDVWWTKTDTTRQQGISQLVSMLMMLKTIDPRSDATLVLRGQRSKFKNEQSVRIALAARLTR